MEAILRYLVREDRSIDDKQVAMDHVRNLFARLTRYEQALELIAGGGTGDVYPEHEAYYQLVDIAKKALDEGKGA